MRPLLIICGLCLNFLVQAQEADSISISGVEVDKNKPDKADIIESRTADRIIEFTSSDVLTTPNPTPEAVALYRFIKDMFGKKILSGQMWTPWGINEIDYVISKTGKKPAIAGFDYINEPQNAGENQKAIDYWKNGGISTMMWHWGAPGVGEGYENSKATILIDQCFVVGTPEYEDFRADLKRIGDWLQLLKDANVPVLWRPFHEFDGGWFWWGKEGPEKFKKLWITMYEYLVDERGLNNLIWVLCYTSNPDGAWFPGSQYVDIAGADTYDNTTDSHLSMYNDVLGSIDGNNYPIAFHETGIPPNAEECIVDGAMWSWWMVWHTDWLEGIDEQYLTSQYQSHLVMSHDELPDILSVYGWEESCSPASVTASVQIDGGDWEETNTIKMGSGSLATLRVETPEEGTWDWSGYNMTGRIGTSSEQIIETDELGTITTTFLNNCGATTTQTFHVVNEKPGMTLAVKSSDDLFTSYPSPASRFLNIKLEHEKSDQLVNIRIHNLNGQLVMDARAMDDEFALDISHLSAGIYNLTVNNEHIFSTKKFIKQAE